MITAEIFSPELLLIVILAALVLFGGTRLPKLARSLGSAQSEFKKGLAESAEGKGAKAADGAEEEAKDAPAEAKVEDKTEEESREKTDNSKA